MIGFWKLINLRASNKINEERMEEKSRVSNPPRPRNQVMHRLGFLLESQFVKKIFALLTGMDYPIARTVSLAQTVSFTDCPVARSVLRA